MKKILIVILLIFPFVLNAQSKIIETKSSGGKIYFAKSDPESEVWDIAWSGVFAVAGSTVIYSEKKWDNTESSFSAKIMSIAGPYISFRADSGGYSEGSAHPFSATSFTTVNIKDGRKVKLTDIFSEKEVLEVLLKDGVIKKALDGATPKTLKDLISSVDGGCDFYFGENSLDGFVFHHVKGDMVAVRLGLGHGCEAMRGTFTQLGFYLKIPENLKKSLEYAMKAGLLMNKMNKIKY